MNNIDYFRESKTQPNPLETKYWIDLTADPHGQIIKCWNGDEWVEINQAKNDLQDEEIKTLQGRCDTLEETKVDKSIYNKFVDESVKKHNELEKNKADKATTLKGYGITDAYTKTETNNQISKLISDLVAQAPETLNTLDELAAALGDDPNFATTVMSEIGKKASSSNVYTKTQCDSKIDEKLDNANIVSSTDVTSIKVVSELPTYQETGILYIKIS